jgi:hypothetical protein
MHGRAYRTTHASPSGSYPRPGLGVVFWEKADRPGVILSEGHSVCFWVHLLAWDMNFGLLDGCLFGMSWEAQDGWDAFHVFTSFCGYVPRVFFCLMKLVERTLALRGCCYPHDSQRGCYYDLASLMPISILFALNSYYTLIFDIHAPAPHASQSTHLSFPVLPLLKN